MEITMFLARVWVAWKVKSLSSAGKQSSLKCLAHPIIKYGEVVKIKIIRWVSRSRSYLK